MFSTKFDNNELKVIIEEPVRKELISKGINPVEVFRLVESFAAKILASKQDDQIKITNEETGASLALDVKWEAEDKVTVQVTIINLENLKVQEQPKSKVNLAQMAEAEIPEAEQAGNA